MSLTCPHCGRSDLPEHSRFCLICAAPLDGSAGVAEPRERYTPDHVRVLTGPRSVQEGERKEVSVLVADVAGSLAMAERLDPEDTHVLMDAFFALALDAVHAEHGTLNQFRGDGFQALFGAPRAREEHAVHAIRAALAIRERVEAYSASVRARFGVPLVLRMGVHSGTVYVGPIGSEARQDYVAEGPTVGVAVRLEGLASPGQILASGDTAQRAQGFFEFRALGPRELRGVSGPVETHEVVRASAHESRLDAERIRGLTPFVGREDVVQTLHQKLRRTSRGALLLSGEAGIGKSRLALELRRRWEGAWLEGRCRESQHTQAYAVWLDLLRRWPAELPGSEAAAELVVALEGRRGAQSPDDLTAALGALLEGAGHAVVQLEDVHWMDRASRRLCEALLERPAANGLRLLLTTRPVGEAPLEAGPAVETFSVPPLSTEERLALARAVLADDAERELLAELAVERGGGNPLFVQEVARSLEEGSAEVRQAARLEASWRRSANRVPGTLQEVIAARIDALPDPAKRLLQCAAVLGRRFDAPLLERIDPESEERTAALLDELVERGLLLRSGTELDFHHALCRDVAYAQTLRQRRRALHQRCGEALEALALPDTPETASSLAHHYDHAGAAERALPLLVRAGKGYLELFAAREAVSHLRRAWEMLCDPDATLHVEDALWLEVGLSLASALNTLDRVGEAAAVLEALDIDRVDPDDRVRLAEACVEHGWVRFSRENETHQSRILVERGLDLARDERAGRVVLAKGHAYLVRILHFDGQIDRAAESARRVTELATGAGDRFGVVFGLGNEGFVRCDAGEVRKACALCEQAVALAEEARHEVGIAFAYAWQSRALAYRGELDRALAAAERARQAGERGGQQAAIYTADTSEAMVHLLSGQPGRAAEAIERLTRIDATWLTTYDWLALARLETGRFDEAIDLANQALSRHPPPLLRTRLLRTLGMALAGPRHADLGRAEQAIEEALSLAGELGLRPQVAECHWALAELCAHRDDDRRASYYADRALREWSACGMPVHADRARAVLAGGLA
ncbi:MAG: adenylate/guanylate cyclase domain-containing protein [Myxococcota bacterium]|nr:adenylate/guanylate cyclase domain-containing protein [Myxococcota bacterium]